VYVTGTSREAEEKKAIARLCGELQRGRLSRRKFLSRLGYLGITASFGPTILAACGGGEGKEEGAPLGGGPEKVQNWLKDMGGPFKGTTLHIVSEATPPSRAILSMAQDEFEPATGMTIDWELLPLDQVLQKISVDASGKQGQYDMYYLDQAWIARFKNDTIDPQEYDEKKPDLRFPNYNWDDFLAPLVQHVATFQDKLVGIPADIPIFITMYRKDIFDEMGLSVPKTMDEYLEVVKEINKERAPKTYGTVGQIKSGHYSLECDWTAWLWSQGGSVFNPDGECVVNDENGIAGLEYLMELKKYMPPGATTWDWSGEANAFAQGKGGLYTAWGEFFPLYNTPDKSVVVKKVYPADPPKEKALRSPEDSGFEETPGIAHQGGSVYAMSAYSNNKDALWVFLQWATSSDVQTRGSLLGGGASPMRQSTFDDSRIKETQKPGGLTQHFPVQERAIKTRMGTEPHLPSWPKIANEVFAVELGKLVTGEQNIATTANNMKKGADRKAASFRGMA
jgi:multiple sugar transport system substrate-binding protein